MTLDIEIKTQGGIISGEAKYTSIEIETLGILNNYYVNNLDVSQVKFFINDQKLDLNAEQIDLVEEYIIDEAFF